ncbi:MAG: cytidylate kinase-like family protein [Dehalococcoidia bacterium]|jgi:cytidylate kinase
MIENAPYVITISRQIGSGGAYIGQRLATKLGISYIDREIVHQTAQRLNISEKNIISRDERVTPLWRSMLESSIYSDPYGYAPPSINITTDKELYQAESDIILDISKRTSAVIIGRGGHYVLRNHSRHLSIFLHADIAFRQQRIQELYHLSSSEAWKMVHSTDESRASYLRALTRGDWADARQYHISLDTGILGLELVEDIIIAAVRARFG